MRRSTAARAAHVIGWFLMALAGPACSHTPFESSTIARLHDGWLELAVKMSPVSAQALLDRSDDPAATLPENLAPLKPQLEERGAQLYEMTGKGARLTVQRTDVEASPDGDVLFRLAAAPARPGPMQFRAVYIGKLAANHTATLLVQDEAGRTLLWSEITRDEPTLTFDLPEPGALRPPPITPGFGSFLRLGIEHILTGYDHLLFLAGLLVVCRRFTSMALIITCFTLAHSLTLALAALQIIVVPSRLVEALIAASIVFVGLENLLRREEPKARWAVTLGFGLIHGLGFAGALRETGLGADGASLAGPLFAFNLGVEIGQMAVAAVALPTLLYLRRWPAFTRSGIPAISAVVIILGAYWLLEPLA